MKKKMRETKNLLCVKKNINRMKKRVVNLQ